MDDELMLVGDEFAADDSEILLFGYEYFHLWNFSYYLEESC